jgi:hypothetical protein
MRATENERNCVSAHVSPEPFTPDFRDGTADIARFRDKIFISLFAINKLTAVRKLNPFAMR